MKLQRWSKSGSTKTRSDRCVPDSCDVIGRSVLKGLVERTKDSAVIAMDAVQVAQSQVAENGSVIYTNVSFVLLVYEL